MALSGSVLILSSAYCRFFFCFRLRRLIGLGPLPPLQLIFTILFCHYHYSRVFLISTLCLEGANPAVRLDRLVRDFPLSFGSPGPMTTPSCHRFFHDIPHDYRLSEDLPIRRTHGLFLFGTYCFVTILYHARFYSFLSSWLPVMLKFFRSMSF